MVAVADKHTRKETTKITKENSTEEHKWKRAVRDHVRKKLKKQRSTILQAYENKNILHT
jgi:hypothetical protein